MVVMEERTKTFVLLLGLFMFLYMLVKHVVDIQTLFLQDEWENFPFLSLIYERMGHKERNIWSQQRMSGFVESLLLELWTGREFRKQV